MKIDAKDFMRWLTDNQYTMTLNVNNGDGYKITYQYNMSNDAALLLTRYLEQLGGEEV